ncbi:sigma-70 family RNA polymerase sigma factor [Sorangium sp. So ce362]|uniref:RNA polymerase sigma factor n=1 Tax=Sorangium sp. So ce362 TaxID=3133303 RepID=UPI003F5DA683
MGKPAGTFSSFELFRRLARRFGVPARDAEDVAQDALLRGLDADRRMEAGGDPAPYRVTIAANQARNHVRNARRRGEVLTPCDGPELHDERATPEELLLWRQREALVRELIEGVDPKYREVLIKHDLEEIPLAQIAAELGLHPDAVKTQHRRALKQLEVAAQRWKAKRRARGWDETACVVPFGLYRREGWISSLFRWSWRILVQGATVVVMSAILAAVTSSSTLESWVRSALGDRWTELTGQAPAPVPAERHPGEAGTSTASPPVQAPAPLPAERSAGQPGAEVNTTPAPSVTTAPHAASSARPVPPTISARERSLIGQARKAIEAHTAEADLEARRLLDAHAREFPRGRLAAEREEMVRQLR